MFADTPGLFAPRRRLDRAMVGAAWDGAASADRVLVLVDSLRGLDADTRALLARLKKTGPEALAVLNKVDAVDKPRLLSLARALDESGLFAEIFMVSALTGEGLEPLLDNLAAALPPGPWLFPRTSSPTCRNACGRRR